MNRGQFLARTYVVFLTISNPARGGEFPAEEEEQSVDCYIFVTISNPAGGGPVKEKTKYVDCCIFVAKSSNKKCHTSACIFYHQF